MRRIAVINQKGGVGKTTTTANAAAALARAGHRVLAFDLDPQSHLSLHLGLDPASGKPGVYELLTGSASINKARVKVAENFWVVGASIDLAAAEVELVSVLGREVLLRDLLDQHVSGGEKDGRFARYDYVFFDCPPSLGVLTLNGLCAAQEVIIPLQAHYLALQGLGKLLETVLLVSKRINPTLKVAGIAICMHDAGTKLGAEVLDDVRSFLESARRGNVPWSGARLFESVIRRNIKLAESPSYGKSIFDYAPDSNGAKDYERLARELHDPSSMTDPAAPAESPVEVVEGRTSVGQAQGGPTTIATSTTTNPQTATSPAAGDSRSGKEIESAGQPRVARVAAMAKPAATAKPPAPAKPAAMAQPAVTAKPAAAAKPASVRVAAPESKPVAPSDGELVKKPAATAGSSMASKAAAVSKPPSVMKPAAVNQPAGTNKPAVVNKPSATVKRVAASAARGVGGKESHGSGVQTRAIQAPAAATKPRAANESAPAAKSVAASQPGTINKPAAVAKGAPVAKPTVAKRRPPAPLASAEPMTVDPLSVEMSKRREDLSEPVKPATSRSGQAVVPATKSESAVPSGPVVESQVKPM